MQNQTPDWLLNEILSGLQLFISLSLPSAPPAETIQITAAGWAVAFLNSGVRWDELADRKRLNKSFKRLAAKLERWPAPRQVLDNMPRRDDFKQLPHKPMSQTDRKEGCDHVAKIIAGLNKGKAPA